MFEIIWCVLLANRWQLLYVFIISFIIGIILAIETCKLNKEHRKKGFRDGKLYGKTKEIDQQMYKNYMDFQSRNNSSVYLKDDVEHHANKKFN